VEYTYKIETLQPKAEYMRVRYSAEGYQDYVRSFNPRQFDQEHLVGIITRFAPQVVESWERWASHPENVEVETEGVATAEAPFVDPNFDPLHVPVVEDQPQYDLFTQRIEMNMIEDPMQPTVGWTIYDLTSEEQAEVLEFQKGAMRYDRAILLQETDHWVMSDTPEPTQAQLDYRQALRDVPAQAEFPRNIVWPTKPE
jgi:hypothetical protein